MAHHAIITRCRCVPAPPTAVYLMDELAEMARTSPENAEKIAERIGKRLQEKSPVVKFKALRLMRHIIHKGCSQFQRCMQKHANLVRDHVHYKGDQDPYKGDVPNERVRESAKEAVEALFNSVAAPPVKHNLGVSERAPHRGGAAWVGGVEGHVRRRCMHACMHVGACCLHGGRRLLPGAFAWKVARRQMLCPCIVWPRHASRDEPVVGHACCQAHRE